MKNSPWVNMRLNALIGFVLCIFVALCFINHNLEGISEKISANGQARHNITAEYVVINPGEPWDAKETLR